MFYCTICSVRGTFEDVLNKLKLTAAPSTHFLILIKHDSTGLELVPYIAIIIYIYIYM